MAQQTHSPESPAVRLLRRRGGPTVGRISELTGLSTAAVSRQLAGINPLDGAVLAVVRVIGGSDLADEISALADAARWERARLVGVATGGDAA
jgi:hypothetical protein